jgi:hypothetical protein
MFGSAKEKKEGNDEPKRRGTFNVLSGQNEASDKPKRRGTLKALFGGQDEDGEEVRRKSIFNNLDDNLDANKQQSETVGDGGCACVIS